VIVVVTATVPATKIRKRVLLEGRMASLLSRTS
jgi:hypothetical protein